jgi:uncharacterized protein
MHTEPQSPGTANFLAKPAWNPYWVGAGIGVLSWIVFVVVNNPIGVTTALSEVAGACAIPFVGKDAVFSNAYWSKTRPAWDYGTLFLIGTFFGSLTSAILGKTFRIETVPQVWRQRFGSSSIKRLSVAFVGGLLAMYGARMAGGCTSGHGITGSLQLAVSSWTFFITLFVVGIVTARVMFGSIGSIGSKATQS